MASHDAIFLAIFGVLGAVIASPVLITLAQRWLRPDITRAEMVKQIRGEIRRIENLIRRLHDERRLSGIEEAGRVAHDGAKATTSTPAASRCRRTLRAVSAARGVSE